MPNTNFRLTGATGVTGLPAEPPLKAWPTTEGGGSVVSYPQPTKRTGAGAPAGVIGKPWASVGRHRIGVTGLAWYHGIINAVSTESSWAYVKCALYDPHSQGWNTYGGIMWRPTVGAPVSGVAYEFHDFSMMITELTLLGVGITGATGWGATYP
jgi:hypothetical protein